MSSRVYCTVPTHQPGQHDVSCVPPADPGNPELRLLRAIWGLCPSHDECTPADHPEVDYDDWPEDDDEGENHEEGGRHPS